ncbi:DUF2608 domain-containing protein [Candidatus Dependentiae bacterium]
MKMGNVRKLDKIITYLALFLLISLTSCSQKKSTIQEITSIKQAQNELDQADKDTLIIFDVDDTLTYKAANIIFQPWFRKTEEGKKFWAQVIKHSKSQENPLDSKLHVLIKRMINNVDQPIEPGVVNLIKTLQGRGLTVIALTHCITGFVGGTLIQKLRYEKLLEVGIDFSSSFEQKEVCLTHLTSHANRHPLFYNGILLTDAFAKGPVLAEFLDVMQLKPKKVIFFDDNESYVKSVQEEMKKRGIIFKGFVYRAIDKLPPQDFDQKILDYQLKYLKEHDEIISDKRARQAIYN